jgi:hypothetical protein
VVLLLIGRWKFLIQWLVNVFGDGCRQHMGAK